jgi:HAD superfamily hydrolase (TIGR01662 family)
MSKVAIVLGFPASGKSTLAEDLVKRGMARLNRDTEGGKVRSLLPKMEQMLKDGKDVVLDNLFATADERKPFIELARKWGATVDCHWMKTSIEDSQYNACQRMVERYGHVLTPEEIKKSKDPNAFPPAVLFNYRKVFQKPTIAEGFSAIHEVDFVRKNRRGHNAKGLVLDYDGTLRDVAASAGDRTFPVSEDEIRILPGRAQKLKGYLKEGYVLVGVSNQSGVAKGLLSYDTAKELFIATNKKIGVDISFRFCPHKIPPISCWCRKPMPGFGVELANAYKLDPANTIMVGDLKTDETFANRCGFKYEHVDSFFR